MEEERTVPEGEDLDRAVTRGYRIYQHNVREIGEMVFRLTKGAREGVPEKELLAIALDALDRCVTDEGEINGQSTAV